MCNKWKIPTAKKKYFVYFAKSAKPDLEKSWNNNDIINDKMNITPAIMASWWIFDSSILENEIIPIMIENEARNAKGWAFFIRKSGEVVGTWSVKVGVGSRSGYLFN